MNHVWVANYSHKYGTDTCVYDTEETMQAGIFSAMMEFLEDYWQEGEGVEDLLQAIRNGDLPEAIDLWNDTVNEEWWEMMYVPIQTDRCIPTTEEMDAALAHYTKKPAYDGERSITS